VPVSSVVHPVGRVIVSSINVTLPLAPAALAASKRPCTVAPLPTVMDADARIVPTNVEPELMVAELPTVQKTLQARLLPLGALTNCTVLPVAVTRSDYAWQIHPPSGSPWASRVSVPLMLLVGSCPKL